jgi:alkaline phosphatase
LVNRAQANRALSETVALDLAFEKAMEMMGDKMEETLVLVTADYSSTMQMPGYQDRGADIKGE